MTAGQARNFNRSSLSAALVTAMVVPVAFSAFAQDSSETKATDLEKVTVTGTLIPQSEIETATPVTTITAEDIK
ncbi:hypothetical protein, partial [Xanthomonas cerealis]|uniref:hypothetical protein n=1 Tax=Xanthomonas cerealis TaxID=3390025 RepID=UPI00114CE7D6